MQTLQWAVSNGAPWSADELVPVVNSRYVFRQTEGIWCLICLLKRQPDAVKARRPEWSHCLWPTLRAALQACRAGGPHAGTLIADLVF